MKPRVLCNMYTIYSKEKSIPPYHHTTIPEGFSFLLQPAQPAFDPRSLSGVYAPPPVNLAPPALAFAPQFLNLAPPSDSASKPHSPASTGPRCRGDENPTGMVVWWYDFLEHKIYTLLAVRTACFYVYAIERWLKPRVLCNMYTIYSKEKIIPPYHHTRRIFISCSI